MLETGALTPANSYPRSAFIHWTGAGALKRTIVRNAAAC
jgi:hypothetical protein